MTPVLFSVHPDHFVKVSVRITCNLRIKLIKNYQLTEFTVFTGNYCISSAGILLLSHVVHHEQYNGSLLQPRSRRVPVKKFRTGNMHALAEPACRDRWKTSECIC